ncbi:S-adenosyl-L-homocysteine hydrolase [Podila minutissima]|uniref:S-adenosyl-L-homocysteine hydrolase n=1 Tax=Podila minutissima TaxID=64525 RepID=A0A9P5SKQ4_9FUNG|nr:S-adenosyl-L-homocysteine hydrolase [Podila minutissima]
MDSVMKQGLGYNVESASFSYTAWYARVADICFAAFDYREIELAENEMQSLMALRRKYSSQQVFKGARITGSLSMSIQTAALIETLTALGAEVTWSPINIFAAQDHAAASTAARNRDEFVWCLETRMFAFRDGQGLNMILDGGGDLAAPVHENYPHLIPGIRGITEETTLSVLRFYKLLKQNTLKISAISINDSATKTKLNNLHGCRESSTASSAAKDGHMSVMEDNAIVCNIGRSDVEIDAVRLKKSAVSCVTINPQVDRFQVESGNHIILLADGRIVNLA